MEDSFLRYTSFPETDSAHASPSRPLPCQRLAFGRYIAFPSARTLLLDGIPVSIGARAFDLLIVLLTSQGEVVSKEKIIRHVWPTTTVDESNLRFQMGLLRKALGPDRDIVKTIPGRGYLIAGEIEIASAPPFAEPLQLSSQQRALGEAISGLLNVFGRYPDAIASFEAMLTSRLPALADESRATGPILAANPSTQAA
jgi:DNA-binding winged helix-turn-helix (wHTH) protein